MRDYEIIIIDDMTPADELIHHTLPTPVGLIGQYWKLAADDATGRLLADAMGQAAIKAVEGIPLEDLERMTGQPFFDWPE